MSTNTPITNKWTKRFPIAVIVLGIAVLLSYLVITPLPTIQLGASVSESGPGIQRGREADAARYTAMAAYFVQFEGIQRGREADAARYTGLAESYTAQEAARMQRSRNADAARYTAMAKYYLGK